MKVIVNSLVFMLFISSKACTNTLADKLHGEWAYIDTQGEVPDVYLFHPSGRYIVFNDAGTPHPWMPIIEKGDWAIKDKVIVLTNRAFIVPQEFFVLPEYIDPVSKSLEMHIKHISKKELVIVGFDKDGNTYTSHYKRLKPSAPRIIQHYTGSGAAIEELVLTRGGIAVEELGLPLPGGATILKLSYEFSALNEAPSELIVASQDGYEVFRKEITATNGVGEAEILLADMPRIEALTKLIFRVNARSSSTTWKLKVKIY